jgi:hypothetical protein
MAKKSNRVSELEDTITDAYNLLTQEFLTRADYQNAIDEATGLFEDAMPELAEEDSSEEDSSDDAEE